MRRRRRSLSPWMRELAVLYGNGGIRRESALMRQWRQRAADFEEMYRAGLAGKGASWLPPRPPAA